MQVSSKMIDYLVCQIEFISFKSLSIFCMLRLEGYGKCKCKHQPTPEPPKQCQELEGKKCQYGMDEMCGEGGYCRDVSQRY